MRVTLWAVVVISSLFGAAGNILMKLITNRVGELTIGRLTDPIFFFQFVLSPLVVLAIGAAFIGRFLLFVPLSELEVGIVTAVALLLWALFTAVGDMIVFDTDYHPILLLGFVFASAAIYIFVRFS